METSSISGEKNIYAWASFAVDQGTDQYSMLQSVMEHLNCKSTHYEVP